MKIKGDNSFKVINTGSDIQCIDNSWFFLKLSLSPGIYFSQRSHHTLIICPSPKHTSIIQVYRWNRKISLIHHTPKLLFLLCFGYIIEILLLKFF